VSLFSDGDPIGNGPATGGAYSIKASALGIGLHHITATATDVAGNVSASSQALSLPVGSVGGMLAPALSASSDSGTSQSDGITNVSQPTFIGSVAVTSAAVKLFADGNVIGTGTAAGGTYSITASSKLADGQHLITVVVTDAATGLESAPSSALRITIDTVAPAAPSKPRAVAADGLAVSSTFSVTGTGDAGSTVTVYVDDRSAASASALAGSWSATLSGLGTGAHKIDASASDLAGNTSGRSEPLTIGTTAAAAKAVGHKAVGHKATPKAVALVAVGAVPVARFSGHVASVTASISVGARCRLAVSAASPGGRSLALLRGSRLGSMVQRAGRASSLHTALRTAGRVRIELHLNRSQLTHAGLYRMVVGATDASGHATRLRIAFRVR
jgi:hypothetical protein